MTQPINFGTGAPNSGDNLPTVFAKIQANFGVGGLIANASDSTTKAVNTATIQAAIDAAYAAKQTLIRLPAGIYFCNPGIYLDPPGNLRANINAPTNYAFSLELRGEGGAGNNKNFGTQLQFTDGTQPTLIIGPGQGMKVSSLALVNTASYTSRAAQPTSGIGIAISGGTAGASRTLIENCVIQNFSNGIETGFNRDSLSDSFTVRKSLIYNCFKGININNTQNDINLVDDCVIQDCKYTIYNPTCRDITVIGGNLSGTTGAFKALTIGSVSGLSALANDTYEGSTFTNWTFTATLSVSNQFMTDGAFDAFVIKTTNYGLIPVELVSYNSVTLVATFKFYRGWLLAHYLSVNMSSGTDIATELAAATTLYAAERFFVFSGSGFNVSGTHLENVGSVTTVVDTSGTFNVTTFKTSLRKMLFNYAIDQNAYNTSGDSLAIFYNQAVWPFIHTSSGAYAVRVEDLDLGATLVTNGVNLQINATGLFLSSASDWNNPNITVPVGGGIPSFFGGWMSQERGHGEWDFTPFYPQGVSGAIGPYRQGGTLEVAFQGFRPVPSTTPRLTSAQLTTLMGALPSIGGYPVLHGEVIYSVIDWNSGGLAHLWARSAHSFFSYGQNLTVNWTYKGGTNIVQLADTTKMFAGLYIGLNNGGGTLYYVVTGVYPALGYVSVYGQIAGTVGTIYSGGTISQQAYSVTQY